MALKNFEELIRKVQRFESKKRVAVVAAQDEQIPEAYEMVWNQDPALLGGVIKWK